MYSSIVYGLEGRFSGLWLLNKKFKLQKYYHPFIYIPSNELKPNNVQEILACIVAREFRDPLYDVWCGLR